MIYLIKPQSASSGCTDYFMRVYCKINSAWSLVMVNLLLCLAYKLSFIVIQYKQEENLSNICSSVLSKVATIHWISWNYSLKMIQFAHFCHLWHKCLLFSLICQLITDHLLYKSWHNLHCVESLSIFNLLSLPSDIFQLCSFKCQICTDITIRDH